MVLTLRCSDELSRTVICGGGYGHIKVGVRESWIIRLIVDLNSMPK